MQHIFKYIRSFYEKEFHLFYLLLILVMLGVILYFNYWHALEKRCASCGKTWLTNFTGQYLLYLIPFAGAFFLQLLFYKDCSYYRNGWFWCIVLLAPAFFAFRVHFNFHEAFVRNRWPGKEFRFYLHSINWVVKVFVLLVPVTVIWWLKDSNNQPFYGVQLPVAWKPYFIMLAVMLPLLVLAATQKDFQHMYPRAQVLQSMQAGTWQYAVYELCYGFDFVSIEFFFRGFLIVSLLNICGTHCIIPVACFYCTIHLGKPMAEAISSFWGGLLLGIISANTGSVWGSLLVHLGIAWLMELLGWLAMLCC